MKKLLLLLILCPGLAFGGTTYNDWQGNPGTTNTSGATQNTGASPPPSTGNCTVTPGGDPVWTDGDLTTQISFTKNGTWQTVNLTGVEQGDLVVIHVRNTDASNRAIGARPKAESGTHPDARIDDIGTNLHATIMVGGGDTGDIELYAEGTYIEMWHQATIDKANIELVQDGVGTGTAATLVDETGFTAGIYNTTTVSAGGTRLAVILEFTGTNAFQDFGTRHPDRATTVDGDMSAHSWAIGNMKSDTQFEQFYSVLTNTARYIVGYIKAGYTPYENATTDMRDDSHSVINAYTNVTALPVGAKAGIWAFDHPTPNKLLYLRANGATDEVAYDQIQNYGQFLSVCDASRICEYKSDHASMKAFLLGTFDDTAGGSPSNTPVYGLSGGLMRDSLSCGSLMQ